MPITDPVNVDFGVEEMKRLEEFVFNNLTSLKSSLKSLHETKVPKWRKLYKGIPKEAERNFPWPGASNVVIQLIGENCDILKARVIGSIYEILPLWVCRLVGEWDDAEEGEEQRSSIEAYMDLMGLEPTELDLYRVESLAANDMVQFGTVMIKQPWETQMEALVVAPNSDKRGIPTYTQRTKYDGPRPEKLAIESWGATPTATTADTAKFKYHMYPLSKMEIEERFHLGIFEKAKDDKGTELKSILDSPDRQGVDTLTTDKLANQNVDAPQPVEQLAEWDFFECWFWYWHNNVKYRVIYTYHLKTRTKMRAVFNFYPENDEPFELGRLGYTDDGLYGYGFAEMLEYYQEEVTTGHNQRVDNRTLANTSIVTTGQSKVDAGFSLFPMGVYPFGEDFNVHQLGSVYPTSVEEERLTLELAKARCGVESATQGSGGGTTNPKKGGYSAMGTFSVLQTGNRRVNINVTDFRYLHLKLGRKGLRQYAEFGIGDREKYLGAQAKYVKKALENIKKGRLDLPIRAATASINQELEKQNSMLFTQVMQRHYGAIAQILQGVQNPMMPAELKEFLMGSIGGMSQIMARLLKAFNYDDITRMQPELKVIKKLRSQDGQSNVSTPQNQTPTNSGEQGVSEAGGASPANQESGANSTVQPSNGLPSGVPFPVSTGSSK